jgi:prepilin-type N-terminal cleavage/methylation domain-containing protein
MRHEVTQRGFSIAEMTVALAIASLILLTAIPAFSNILGKSRVTAATRQVTGDIRTARGQAIASGWQYKVFGFGSTSTNANKNKYRILGRNNTSTAWPADTSAVLSSATQFAGPWMNISSDYPGVVMDPGGSSSQDRFDVLFDSRGLATMSTSDFTPFRLVGAKDAINVTISPSGGISTATGTVP